MKTVFIYILKDPRIEDPTSCVRYVGKTNNFKKRFRSHLRDVAKSHKASWIKSLGELALSPVLEIIDEVPESEWQQWEVAYIEYFKGLGCDLVNGTSGGDGIHNPTESTRKNMSIARIGKRPSEETRAKMCAAQEVRISKPRSEEARENMRAARVGKKHSPLHCSHMSAALMGHIVSPETRAKIAAAHFGKSLSSEHRKKLCVAWERRRQASILAEMWR